jgi:hypothetical protein
MHDPEKSDSGIVVTKPTNKAGRPVAEPVEPRPGTKGNADQQSTHRAQSRARVTQALGRVRQAARQRKKEQFWLSASSMRATHVASLMLCMTGSGNLHCRSIRTRHA